MSSPLPAPTVVPARLTPETPVVFVHGLIGTLQDPVIRAALGARPAVAPDGFGYGHLRAVDPTLCALDHQVERLRGVVAEGFDRPVVLVGHSVGGVVAALFAHRHPAPVRGNGLTRCQWHGTPL